MKAAFGVSRVPRLVAIVEKDEPGQQSNFLPRNVEVIHYNDLFKYENLFAFME